MHTLRLVSGDFRHSLAVVKPQRALADTKHFIDNRGRLALIV
jgi:hypothetical protein